MKNLISVLSDDVHADFEKAVECISSLGIRTIQLRHYNSTRLPDLAPDDVKEIKRITSSFGVSISAVWPNVLQNSFHEDFDLQKGEFERSVELALELSVPRIIVPCFRRHPKDGRGDYRRIVDLVMDMLECSRGVGVCVTNERGRYVDSGENILRILNILGKEGLGLCWNVGEYYNADLQASTDFYKSVQSYLSVVQLTDLKRDHQFVALGEGRVEWLTLMQNLMKDDQIELMLRTSSSPREASLAANYSTLKSLCLSVEAGAEANE